MIEAAITIIIKNALNIDAYIGYIPEKAPRPAIAMVTLGTVFNKTQQRYDYTKRDVIISLKLHAQDILQAKTLQNNIIRLFGQGYFVEDGIGYCYEIISSVQAAQDMFTELDNSCSVDIHLTLIETKL
ncbi:hypothetical protein ACLHZ0_20550 [Aeromonas salmonicida]|uniref:hypothetical protein n=1 Tax=Aeromonas salmonicida TaxID=645 RepID=UPI003D057AE4